MRILMVNTLYDPMLYGGSEKSVGLLANGLAKFGDDVSVVTLHPDTKETTEVLNGVRVYRMPLDNIYWPFRRVHQQPSFLNCAGIQKIFGMQKLLTVSLESSTLNDRMSSIRINSRDFPLQSGRK